MPKLEFQHVPARKSTHPARRQTHVLPTTTTMITTAAAAAAAAAAASHAPPPPTCRLKPSCSSSQALKLDKSTSGYLRQQAVVGHYASIFDTE